MSSPISTPDALRSEAAACSGAWSGRGWRLVEAQHQVSTLALVDDLDEQALLEDILEETKPTIPEACRGLDALLSTPFRYRPYPHGSRFRRAGFTPGVWYGAERPETAVAEMAFYRLRFHAESPQTPWPDRMAEYTAVVAQIEAPVAVDLTAGALAEHAEVWTHPTDYAPCQALADAARDIGASLIRYASARDPDGGANLAVLACAAFAAPAPVERRSWRMRVGPFGAQAICDSPRRRIAFPWEVFAADPRIGGGTEDPEA